MRALPPHTSRPLLLTVLCALLAGCGLGGQPAAAPFPSFTPRPTVAVAVPGPNGVSRITVTAHNTRFVPPNLHAHPGRLDITLLNDDAEIHNLTVFTTSLESAAGSTDAVSTGTVAGHQTADLLVTLTKPGTYKFFCEFHREDGMFGELTIK